MFPINPILERRKLKHAEINDLLKVTWLENSSFKFTQSGSRICAFNHFTLPPLLLSFSKYIYPNKTANTTNVDLNIFTRNCLEPRQSPMG